MTKFNRNLILYLIIEILTNYTKVFANKLERVLGHCVLEFQSVFILNMCIIDNNIVTFEVLHYVKARRGNFESFQAIKFDMSKACVWVEWKFVEGIVL